MRRLSSRGSSLVEYALLLVGVMIVASLAYRTLGKNVRMSFDKGTASLIGS
jgi:Flp pilus assembly pilin Flp